ncbi:hypothetical protein RMCBS344292_08321 [Rhizopus microsporus]|nr:hypothetical protein RMCBS344292_08321 [Rhizopus microsporus]
MDNIDQLVKQVLIVDDSKDPASIRRDLEYTQNVEATLNRIFDGEFLKGIKDNKPNDTLIILDSDEEDTYQAESRNNAAVKDVNADIFDINTVFSDPVVKTLNTSSKRKFMDPFGDFDDIPVPSSSKKKPTRISDSTSSFLKKAGQSSKGPFDLFNSQEDKGETDRKKKGKERESADNFFLEEELQPVSEDEELFFLKEIDSTITSSIKKSTELIAFNDDEEDILVKKTTERPPKDKSKDDASLLKEIDDEGSFTFAEHEGIGSVNEEKDNTLSREDVSKRSTSTSIFDIEEEEDILHVPTQDEFFDELLSLKKDKIVIDIDSFEEDESNKKRKRRQYDDQHIESNDDRYALLSLEELSSSQDKSALTVKEKKKLEAEERKRKRQEAAEEKKRLKEFKQKEKERQALFEKENRNKTDRTAILKEMILDIHPDFLLTDAGKLLEASLIPKMAEIRPLSEHKEELQPVSEDEELFFLKEIDSTITSSINKSTELIAFSDDEEDILVKKATEHPPKDKSKEDTLLLKEIDDEESFTFAEHEGPESVNEEKDNTLSREDVSKRSTSTSIFDIEEEEDILHVPTQDEFFDELLSLKKDKVVIDIDSFEEDESDEKRKRRQYDDQYKESNDDRYALLSFEEPSSSQDRSALTAKEKKKLEAEERKRKRQKAAEEKKRLKELKQKEKERQALFEKENRNKTDRTAILKEMILDTHPDFLLTDAGKLLEASLTPKMAEIRPLSEHSELRYTISWKRKCQAEWHSESQTFIPLRNMKIIQEPYVLIYMPVDKLNEHIQSETIFDHMEQAQSSAKDRQILLLVEGLEAYYKKRALIQRRHFQNQVRQSIEGPSNDNPSSRKRKSGQENLESLPSRETVEQYLNELQIVKNIMVVPTKNSEDTVVWIENLTIDLGLGRYKTKNLNSTYKGGKSGANEVDTYFKMLQEIQLCTPAIAKSIMKAYPTLQSLHQSYRELDKPSGEMMLADLEVERSAIRARDRNVNRVMSKKIYTIFNSDDPDLFLY